MVSHNQTQREMHKLFLRKVSLLKTYSDRKINKLVDAMTVEEFQVRKRIFIKTINIFKIIENGPFFKQDSR